MDCSGCKNVEAVNSKHDDEIEDQGEDEETIRAHEGEARAATPLAQNYWTASVTSGAKQIREEGWS